MIGAITVLALALQAGAPSAEFQALAAQAVNAQQAGEYEQAAKLYRQLLALDPNQVATHVNLGVVLVNLRRFDEAVAEYKEAEQLLPGDPRIEKNLGLAYEKAGQLQQARGEFARAHEAAPGDASLTLLLADAELQLGNNQRVVDLLSGVDASDGAVNYLMGTALLRLHRISDAQVYLDRILRDQNSAEAHFLLGTRMVESGDYPSAVKEFAAAVERNPNLPGAESSYGQALLMTGDPDAASAAFEKAISMDASDFGANLGLAQIAIARGRFADAEKPATAAIELRPEDGQANLAYAQLLLGLKKYAQARSYCEKAVALLPKDADAHRAAAEVAEALNEKAKANAEWALVAKFKPQDPGPQASELAPDFMLWPANGGVPVALHQFRSHSPVVLVFGSYSCPNFRDSAAALKQLQAKYRSKAEFLLIYIREAHAEGEWQSTRNTREQLTITPAANMEDKTQHAAMCSRSLHLPFPALVDTFDNKTELAYNAWPSRAYIVDRAGRIAYSTRLTELDFHPDEMQAALERVIR